jgi:hypothetical protein
MTSEVTAASMWWVALCLGLGLARPLPAQNRPLDFLNRDRPVADAHNCYPEDGRWGDRIERALGAGFPIAIEQDLAWNVPLYGAYHGPGRVVVSHSAKTTGAEPTLRAYFFERVRPLVEAALAKNQPATWPIIVLHFDFKDTQTPLLEAVWSLLGEYQSWITTAVKSRDPHDLAPFDRKPLLVLTEDSDDQEKVFFDDVPVGERLRVFGSAHTAPIEEKRTAERNRLLVTLPPDRLLTERPTNYRRWWNNGWSVVEEGGQRPAGDWTAADDQRLRALVNHAHRLGFWIRFYTLDGFRSGEGQGWGDNYNFGSREAVEARWKAAIAAGVNLIATDQYEELAKLVRQGN